MDNYRFYTKMGINIYLHKYVDAIVEGVKPSTGPTNCGDFYPSDDWNSGRLRSCQYCQREGGGSSIDGRACPVRLCEKAKEYYNKYFLDIEEYFSGLTKRGRGGNLSIFPSE